MSKPQQRVSTASQTTNLTSSDQAEVVSTRFVVQNPAGEHAQPLAACRVCFATSVRMYYMSKHKLTEMYELVTGIKVNTEDKLPNALCWECVARLSSANNFIQKALKTQQILEKLIDDKTVTTNSDIESIDRAQYQLESTLGFKYYEANNTDLHIQYTSDITNNGSDASHSELLRNTNVKSEQNDENYEFPINSELSDLQDSKFMIFIPDDLMDEEWEFDDDDDDESNLSLSDNSEIPYYILYKVTTDSEGRVERSTGMFNKEPRVVLEDIMLSLNNNNIHHFQANQLKEENNNTTLLTNIIDTNDMDIDSTNISKAVVHSGSGNTSKTGSAAQETLQNLFICGICDKSYKTKGNLIRHIKAHYNLYNCSYCRYQTSKKECLKLHDKAKHTKEQFYKSAHCYCLRKNASSKQTKSTVYSCSYCTFEAYHKTSLSRHVNTKHI